MKDLEDHRLKERQIMRDEDHDQFDVNPRVVMQEATLAKTAGNDEAVCEKMRR